MSIPNTQQRDVLPFVWDYLTRLRPAKECERNMAQISNALTDTFSPAEAFYVVFRALPEKDRLAVVRYILDDEEIWQSPEFSEIPNETTLQAFAEDKTGLPIFQSVDELREDLMS